MALTVHVEPETRTTPTTRLVNSPSRVQVRGLAADGFPASFTSGIVDQIWQDEDIIVPRMRVHYTDVGRIGSCLLKP